MHIASMASTQALAPTMKSQEAKEAPGPDHDGDSNDGGAASTTKSALSSAVGQSLDISA